MKKYIYMVLLISISVCNSNCTDYLAVKSDSSLAVPNSLKDLQALMDYELNNIRNFPGAIDLASDFYFMSNDDIKSVSPNIRDIYLLNGNDISISSWADPYKKIMYTNIVLDNVDLAETNGFSETDRNRIKGTALFNRGWNFYWLAQMFSPPYMKDGASRTLGIPLRTTSNVNVSFQRADQAETYGQILKDLKASILYLPVLPLKKTRPSKMAAYAALSRVCLNMDNLQESLLYADSCLQIQHELLDYNSISVENAIPFDSQNKEVVLLNTSSGTGNIFTGTSGVVDTVLMNKYNQGDLRKGIFFKKNSEGYYSFKGNYGGPANVYTFCGLAIDEVYLIKAECEARLGKLTDARATLQTLISKRYEVDFLPPIPNEKNKMIAFILDEREKELAFRLGIRWSDIRRLNTYYNAGIYIIRKFEGKTYMLPPNDLRSTFLIPTLIVLEGKLQQNPR